MTPKEATALADRICATPGRNLLTRDEWITELLPLDAGAAGTAYVRCIAKHNAPPTPNELLKVYRGTHTRGTDPIPNYACPNCDDGMVTRWIVKHGYPARYAFACGCRHVSAERQPSGITAYHTEHEAWHDPDVTRTPPPAYTAPPTDRNTP